MILLLLLLIIYLIDTFKAIKTTFHLFYKNSPYSMLNGMNGCYCICKRIFSQKTLNMDLSNEYSISSLVLGLQIYRALIGVKYRSG